MNNFPSRETIAHAIATDGYIIIENVLSADFIAKCKAELAEAITKETEYHKGQSYQDYAMVLICSLYGGSFLDLFDNSKITEPFNAVLGDGCTVYAYTSSSMPPQSSNYSNRVHVDCPRIIGLS